MKIAMLSPVTWRTPPRNYGPWEQVTSVLTEALVKLGVNVTLFATGDSVTQAGLRSVVQHPLGEKGGDAKVWEGLHISQVMESANEFDIIHNHFDFQPLTYSRLIRTPIITTIHGFSSEAIVPVYQKYNNNTFYVAISNSDRHPSLEYVDTVYNGIDEDQFKLGNGQGEYLLYFGRIHPEKGTHRAIDIARESGIPLIICGLVQDDRYFREQVLPHIDQTTVSFKGNVGPSVRNALMGDALALLHPISFQEPFGLSVAEAMFCGTPVIAFNRGAMKELIVDSKTGYLVEGTREAVEAVKKIKAINRHDCREHARRKFSSQAMAAGYMEVYQKVLNKPGSGFSI